MKTVLMQFSILLLSLLCSTPVLSQTYGYGSTSSYSSYGSSTSSYSTYRPSYSSSSPGYYSSYSYSQPRYYQQSLYRSYLFPSYTSYRSTHSSGYHPYSYASSSYSSTPYWKRYQGYSNQLNNFYNQLERQRRATLNWVYHADSAPALRPLQSAQFDQVLRVQIQMEDEMGQEYLIQQQDILNSENKVE